MACFWTLGRFIPPGPLAVLSFLGHWPFYPAWASEPGPGPASGPGPWPASGPLAVLSRLGPWPCHRSWALGHFILPGLLGLVLGLLLGLILGLHLGPWPFYPAWALGRFIIPGPLAVFYSAWASEPGPGPASGPGLGPASGPLVVLSRLGPWPFYHSWALGRFILPGLLGLVLNLLLGLVLGLLLGLVLGLLLGRFIIPGPLAVLSRLGF